MRSKWFSAFCVAALLVSQTGQVMASSLDDMAFPWGIAGEAVDISEGGVKEEQGDISKEAPCDSSILSENAVMPEEEEEISVSGEAAKEADTLSEDSLEPVSSDGAGAREEPAGGMIVDNKTFGGNLKWSLDDSKNLTISGNGRMPDYDSFSKTPWSDYKAQFTHVTFEKGITYIGKNSFNGVTGLTEVTMADSVAQIGEAAFKNTRVGALVLSKGLTGIGQEAFYNCDNLVSITIPSGVNTINSQAFMQCGSLTQVTLSKGVESVGYQAFYQSGVKTLYASRDLKNIGYSAFNESIDDIFYEGTEEDWKNEVVAADGNSIDLSHVNFHPGQNISATDKEGVPAPEILREGSLNDKVSWSLNNQGLLSIFGTGRMPDYESFSDYPWSGYSTAITHVEFRDGVTNIGSFAFNGLTDLTSVSMNDSIAQIGEMAFKNTGIANDLELSRGLTGIGQEAFYNCDNLTSITIPSGVNTVNSQAFMQCTSLTEVILSKGVESVGYQAFYQAPVRRLHASEDLKHIGYSAFSPGSYTSTTNNNCILNLFYGGDSSAWEKVIIAGGNSRIIKEHTELAYSRVIPESDTTHVPEAGTVKKASLGTGLTWELDDRGLMTISGNGRMPDYDSFSKTPWADYKRCITRVVFGEGVLSIGKNTFNGVLDLTGITMADSVAQIEEAAFKNTGIANDLEFSYGLTGTGVEAFYNCDNLVSVTIPGRMKTVNEQVFMQCSSLTSVRFSPGTDTVGMKSFYQCNSLERLSVPASIKNIGANAFGGCGDHIKDIYYGSTEEDWNRIVKANGNTFIQSDRTDYHYSQSVPATGVRLNRKTMEINWGEEAELKAFIIPMDASNQKVTFSSTPEGIVTLDQSGKISTLSRGNALVTVTTDDGNFTDTCQVSVVKIDVTGVTLDKDEAELTVGDVLALKAGVQPENASVKTVSFNSSDPSVAVVDDSGKVTAVGKGTCNITVTSKDGGFSKKCSLTVTRVDVKGVSLNMAKAELTEGETLTLEATVSPNNATVKTVSFNSSDPSVAVVDDRGKVTGVGEGIATVTVTTMEGGFKAECIVTVKKAGPVAVTGVTLDRQTAELTEGDTLLLKATITPANATDQGLSWKSSSKKTAVVSQNGMVTALKEGTAIISVTTLDGGKTADCKVTVKAKPVTPIDPEKPVDPVKDSEFQVIFYSRDTEIWREKVSYGDTVSNVPDVSETGDGFFVGWYTVEGTLFDETAPIVKNLALEARFAGGVSDNDGRDHSGLDPSLFVTEERDVYMVVNQSATLPHSQGQTWKATDSKQKVVKISSGYKIKASKTGDTDVSSSDEKLVYRIHVRNPELRLKTDGKLDSKTTKKTDVVIGNNAELTVYGLGDLEDMYDITWTSSKPEIATVIDGMVYGAAKGSSKISAYIGGRAYTCTVNVKDIYKVPEYKGTLVISPLQSVTVKYTDGFKVKNGVWTSSDGSLKPVMKSDGKKVNYYQNDVVRITPAGKITATGTGTTALFVKKGEQEKGFIVRVDNTPRNNVFISAGKNRSLKYYNVKNSNAVWSVSESTAGTSLQLNNKGKVTAGNKQDKALINCDYKGYADTKGFRYETMVYAENPVISGGSKTNRIEAVGTKKTSYKLTLENGETAVIRIDGVYQKPLFSSNKPAVAFVDEAGVITTRGKGTAKLSTKINGTTYSISVTVRQ